MRAGKTPILRQRKARIIETVYTIAALYAKPTCKAKWAFSLSCPCLAGRRVEFYEQSCGTRFTSWQAR